MPLYLMPISLAEVQAYVDRFHRHHVAPWGWKFGMAVGDGDKIVGVASVGRPVARRQDDGWTLEVTRCCTDGTRNACTKLYAAAEQVAMGLGYRRLITYTLAEEEGASLRAANWRDLGERKSHTWNMPSRPREDKHPTGTKRLWMSPRSVETKHLAPRLVVTAAPTGVEQPTLWAQEGAACTWVPTMGDG